MKSFSSLQKDKAQRFLIGKYVLYGKNVKNYYIIFGIDWILLIKAIIKKFECLHSKSILDHQKPFLLLSIQNTTPVSSSQRGA